MLAAVIVRSRCFGRSAESFRLALAVTALTVSLCALTPTAQAQNAPPKPTAKPIKASKPLAKPVASKTPVAKANGEKPAIAGTAAWSGNTAREFSITSKSYEEKTGPTGATMTLAGDVLITSLETKLKTDAATFDRSAQLATSPGKFQFDDVQQTVTADSGSANYKTQQADLKAAQILVRSLPESGAKELGPLTGDAATYNWKDRQAIVTGNVTLKLKSRTITADKAVYNGREEKIEFTGNVTIVNEAGDKMTAPKATFVMKEGAEQMNLEDGVNSVLKVQDGAGA